MDIHKIVPCVWFVSQAEEAVKLYVSVFANSAIKRITRYTAAGQEIHGKKAARATKAMLEMKKLDIAALKKAFDGG